VAISQLALASAHKPRSYNTRLAFLISISDLMMKKEPTTSGRHVSSHPSTLRASSPSTPEQQCNSTSHTRQPIFPGLSCSNEQVLTPITLVSNANAQPSMPSSQCSRFQRPTCFICLSLHQGPIGNLNTFSTTFSKPASSIYPLANSWIRSVLPNLSPASSETEPHCPNILSGVTVPSSDCGTTEISTCSIQPPGLRWLF